MFDPSINMISRGFTLIEEGGQQLYSCQRWISSLFYNKPQSIEFR